LPQTREHYLPPRFNKRQYSGDCALAELQTILELTAKIISAYLARNQAAPEALPGLIQDVYRSLDGISALPETPTQEPAVPIRRSVFPDHIVCLEDGKHFAMLKRHLRTDHAMTPEQYRAKWGLPASYPMTAPNYASYRAELARNFGLGQKAAVLAAELGEELEVQKIPAQPARGLKG